MSLAASASVVTGLALDATVAATFGAGGATDAFFVAARLPLAVTTIVVVASNQVLVPVFATWFVRRGAAGTATLISLVLTATVVATAAVATVVAATALPLVQLTAPGLDETAVSLSATVLRWMIVIVPLTAAAEVTRAYLNTRQVIVAPAAMHVVLNGVAVAVVLTMSEAGVVAVAWGYLAGALAQLSLLAALALRTGLRYRPGLQLRDPDLRAAARLTTRPVLAASLNPIARIGEQVLVSFLPPGSISLMNYGYRLISAIGGSVFFRSVIATIMPRLSTASAEGDDRQVGRLVLLGVRLMVAVSLPLTALMATLAGPAVVAVFMRGSFTESDTALLGMILTVYAASLLGSGTQRALLSYFYARLDTVTPFRNTAYGVAANLGILLVLVPVVRPHGRLAVLAVPVAYGVAQYVNVGHAWYRLSRSLTGFTLLPVRAFALWTAVASVAATGAMVLGARSLDVYGAGSGVGLLVRTAGAGLVGTAVLAATWIGARRRVAWPVAK